jgi:DNA helicase HerA-like ATPase
MQVTLPTGDKRTAIVGSTGSGKTQFAVWLLASRDFHRRPWIIFDFKGDELIAELGATEISIFGAPPKKPGLYVVRPIPELHDKAVVAFLWRIWARGKTGIYIDEGYMLGARNPALNACLTQGRSKKIEMIILSQRPVWMSRFVFSEANFFAVFNLNLEDDRRHVSTFLGGQRINLLPRFHCQWYDCDGQRGTLLAPVPDRETLIQRFEQRLSKRRKLISTGGVFPWTKLFSTGRSPIGSPSS